MLAAYHPVEGFYAEPGSCKNVDCLSLESRLLASRRSHLIITSSHRQAQNEHRASSQEAARTGG